jgi:hypothetical protein
MEFKERKIDFRKAEHLCAELKWHPDVGELEGEEHEALHGTERLG